MRSAIAEPPEFAYGVSVMPGFRGRAIVYPLVLIGCWIGGRAAYLGWKTSLQPALSSVVKHHELAPRRWVSRPNGVDQRAALTIKTPERNRPAGGVARTTGKRHFGLSASRERPVAAQQTRMQNAVADGHATDSSHGSNLPMEGQEKGGSFGNARWFGYGYSFWRLAGKGGTNAAAPGGQYGGSQGGLILGYDLQGPRDKGLALLLRAAATPDRGGEELALGLRWQRPAKLPLSLNAERRFVIDGRDRWAVYAAGGIDAGPLPAKFTLDAFGQAGWTSGRDGGAFFDAQARVMRPVTTIGGITIKAGAGAWAGGQEDVRRLDVGPALAAQFPLAKTRLDLRLDWRQRVAGDAEPKSGPAITLSTGF
jgi:hypothetical protein